MNTYQIYVLFLLQHDKQDILPILVGTVDMFIDNYGELSTIRMTMLTTEKIQYECTYTKFM